MENITLAPVEGVLIELAFLRQIGERVSCLGTANDRRPTSILSHSIPIDGASMHDCWERLLRNYVERADSPEYLEGRTDSDRAMRAFCVEFRPLFAGQLKLDDGARVAGDDVLTASNIAGLPLMNTPKLIDFILGESPPALQHDMREVWKLLLSVAEHARRLNDAQLNGSMMQLGMYDEALPELADYNPQLVLETVLLAAKLNAGVNPALEGREHFESYVKAAGLDVTRTDGIYADMSVQYMWVGYEIGLNKGGGKSAEELARKARALVDSKGNVATHHAQGAPDVMCSHCISYADHPHQPTCPLAALKEELSKWEEVK